VLGRPTECRFRKLTAAGNIHLVIRSERRTENLMTREAQRLEPYICIALKELDNS
jgi:hypothetical protein